MNVFYYLVTLTQGTRVVERGWMLAASDTELITYARTCGYGIDIELLGEADMRAILPRLLHDHDGTVQALLARRVVEALS